MLHGAIVILVSLLSEADFFVDGKDLQTFVGATSQSRFFFAFSVFSRWRAGRVQPRRRCFVGFASVTSRADGMPAGCAQSSIT